MIPYEKLTIIRNRHRVRDLSRFRGLVESYFEGAEYATDNLPVDWEGARRARSQINQMLPRVMQIVHAARLDAPLTTNTGPCPAVADVAVIREIFDARYADGGEQEILDIIDMAIGVYDASRFNCLVRTVNPFHYAGTLLTFVARLPGRAFKALFSTNRPRYRNLKSRDLERLEDVVNRLSDVEALLERRFEEINERQDEWFINNNNQLLELSERLDYAEGVLEREKKIKRLKPGKENDVVTPV